jgi:hypothetical protein
VTVEKWFIRYLLGCEMEELSKTGGVPRQMCIFTSYWTAVPGFGTWPSPTQAMGFPSKSRMNLSKEMQQV